jgi:hypothetical protein
LNLQRQSPHGTALHCAFAKLDVSDVMVGVQPDCQTSLPPAGDPPGSPLGAARPRPGSVAHPLRTHPRRAEGRFRLQARKFGKNLRKADRLRSYCQSCFSDHRLAILPHPPARCKGPVCRLRKDRSAVTLN